MRPNSLLLQLHWPQLSYVLAHASRKKLWRKKKGWESYKCSARRWDSSRGIFSEPYKREGAWSNRPAFSLLLLVFLTGSDRIPIYGMSSLRIVIQSTASGEQYLPVAHTCYNLLDLPKYSSKEILSARLVQAIDHYEGFSLAWRVWERHRHLGTEEESDGLGFIFIKEGIRTFWGKK